MQKSSKKDELWRYALQTWEAANGTTGPPQQQLRHLPQRLPQPHHPYHSHQHQQQQQIQKQSTQVSLHPSTLSFGNYPTLVSTEPENRGCHQLAPTSNVMHAGMDAMDTSSPAYSMESESQEDFNKYGYCFASCSDDVLVKKSEPPSDSVSNCSSSNSNSSMSISISKKCGKSPAKETISRIFQNWCGLINSRVTTGINNNNNNNYEFKNSSSRKKSFSQQQRRNSVIRHPAYAPYQEIMRELKDKQKAMLLIAVEYRLKETSTKVTAPILGTPALPLKQCILVRRSSKIGKKPHLNVCQLFFWQDLTEASQLKRSVMCPSENDPVYACCNPLHWYRIMEADTGPPPYQQPKMEGLNVLGGTSGESSHDGGSDFQITPIPKTGCSTSSTIEKKSNLYARIPESFSTEGEGCNPCASLVWCKLYYWEQRERVGKVFEAIKPSINIYSEGDFSDGDGFSLKKVAAERTSPAPVNVQNVREHIGLGVTLSQEADGVWLYNRSTVPVFIDSPTVAESRNGCRIRPGDCVKAFDSQKVPLYISQLSNAQEGPRDPFRISISFIKNWGSAYKRQNITTCECWIEVFFTR